MVQTAEQFYKPYEGVDPNEIQLAQNEFMNDTTRSAGSEVSPEERKHSLAQGFLLNNKVREDVDMDGDPLNRVVGKILDMKSVRKAQDLTRKAEKDDADKRKYIGPGDAELQAVEKATQEVIFGESDPRIVTIPVAGMAVGFGEAFKFIHEKHPEITHVLKGSNGYGGYNSVIKEHFDGLLHYRHGTDNHEFDMDSFEKTLKGLEDPSKVLLLLQAGAYNYTSVNPNSEQKKKIVELIAKYGLVTLLDSAYQGLENGMEEDVEFARLLRQTDIPFFVYDSYSKKAQLYAKRIGFMHFAVGNEDKAKIMRGRLYAQLRAHFLTGTDNFRIIYQLLSNPELKRIWQEEDIPEAQQILYQTKVQVSESLDDQYRYVHPDKTQGMFVGLPISHEGIMWMRKEKGVYVVKTKNQDTGQEAARVNMGSIAEDSVQYISETLNEALTKFAA